MKRLYEDLIDLEGASAELSQLPDENLAKKAGRQIQRKMNKIKATINDVCMPDFRGAIKGLFRGLTTKIKGVYSTDLVNITLGAINKTKLIKQNTTRMLLHYYRELTLNKITEECLLGTIYGVVRLLVISMP